MALWENSYQKLSAKLVSYQVTGDDFLTMFTTRGATVAVTFTLPPTADIQAGWRCKFYSVSAYGMVVASSGSADNIVGLNDAALDTLTATTTSLMIGVSIEVTWDGTSWLSERGAGGTITGA